MSEVSLRDHIERILAEKDIRRDEQFRASSEALKLQAAETERRLEAYPSLRDFNNLKERVTTIVALFQVLSVLSLIAGAVIAFFAYVK